MHIAVGSSNCGTLNNDIGGENQGKLFPPLLVLRVPANCDYHVWSIDQIHFDNHWRIKDNRGNLCLPRVIEIALCRMKWLEERGQSKNKDISPKKWKSNNNPSGLCQLAYLQKPICLISRFLILKLAERQPGYAHEIIGSYCFDLNANFTVYRAGIICNDNNAWRICNNVRRIICNVQSVHLHTLAYISRYTSACSANTAIASFPRHSWSTFRDAVRLNSSLTRDRKERG